MTVQTTALIGYTPQTRPLRRLFKSRNPGHQSLHRPTQVDAVAPEAPACPSCNGKLNELARARVFARREDGQRFRCVSCSNRYISFMGNLLQL